MTNWPKPLMFRIFNGFGVRKDDKHYAIVVVNISWLNTFLKGYPKVAWECSIDGKGHSQGYAADSKQLVPRIRFGSNKPSLNVGDLASLVFSMLVFWGMRHPVEMKGRSLIG